MLTNNIDVSDGLTNGAIGTVTHIVKSSSQSIILVKFDNSLVGQHAKQCSQFKHIDPHSVPINQYQATFYIHGKKSAQASCTQFPLILSWAVTIHKIQGLTLDSVVVDMSPDKGDYQDGQAYVAFSHVKSLSGLHIVNYSRSQIKVDKHIHQFMENNKLRQIPMPQCTETNGLSEVITVTHQNVQGAFVHKLDIDNHQSLLSADVICMTETHLQTSSNWPVKKIPISKFSIYRQE